MLCRCMEEYRNYCAAKCNNFLGKCLLMANFLTVDFKGDTGELKLIVPCTFNCF